MVLHSKKESNQRHIRTMYQAADSGKHTQVTECFQARDTAARDLNGDLFRVLPWPESLDKYTQYFKAFMKFSPSQSRMTAKEPQKAQGKDFVWQWHAWVTTEVSTHAWRIVDFFVVRLFHFCAPHLGESTFSKYLKCSVNQVSQSGTVKDKQIEW